MKVPKLRAAILVFCIGFALGLSVFAVSRLFIRSVLNADAVAAAEELAGRLASGEEVAAIGTLSAVVRYTYFDLDGRALESAELNAGGSFRPAMNAAEIEVASAQAAQGEAVVVQSPLALTLLGLSEPAVKGVAVPVRSDGRALGSVYAEIDQTLALGSLARAFSLGAMVTVGLAVLAVIAIAFAVTRGRGLTPQRKAFDPNALPRDPLLGIPMRQGFVMALDHAVERAVEEDRQVGLMLVDLDQLRAVNDIWGHKAGDEVLKSVAERLRKFASGPAALARIGGDEFALIVDKDVTSHSMRQLAERIRLALAVPYPVSGSSVSLSASMAAAVYPVNAENAAMLFRAADVALSKARSEGGDALVFFDTEMGARMSRQAELERDLRQALEREEFVIFYQPQLELASGRLRGYEALVRWERPGQGILSPRDFLDVAEETGLIGPLGDWVLRKACQDAASWLDSGTVAVNFCAAQFRSGDLDQTIAKILAECGLPAERLEIEVPESLFLKPAHDVMETLNRIKALGVRIAMDDFGASYSSLAFLAHFPFDKIKIDKSFVNQLTQDADVAAIVASIIGLGRALSVDITAEGVETSEQVTLLKAAGCSVVQGFLFGMPKRDAGVATAYRNSPAGTASAR